MRDRPRGGSLAAGATIEDLAFGKDYELLAAAPDPGGSTSSAAARRAKASRSAWTAGRRRSKDGSTFEHFKPLYLVVRL